MFTIVEWRNLGEAIEFWSRLDLDEAEEIGPVLAAARQTLDRWQECDCDDGVTNDWVCRWEANGYNACTSGNRIHEPEFCGFKRHQSCGGSGVLPNQAGTFGVSENEVVWTQGFGFASGAYTSLPDGDYAVRAFDKPSLLDVLCVETHYLDDPSKNNCGCYDKEPSDG